MKRLIYTLLFLSISGIAVGQTQKQWLKHAEKSFMEKDFYGASIYYREAMMQDSSNLYVVYRYAESLKQYHDYRKAEHYYKYVWLKDKSKNYPESIFWMAMMQKNNGKYAEARKNFLTYSKSNRDKNSYSYKKATQEVGSCEFAMELMKKPMEGIVYNIGDSINTVNSEFAPVKVNDSVLFFSSLQYKFLQENNSIKDKNFHTTIYKAERKDTVWIRHSELDTTINKGLLHNANGCFSPDRSEFYFSRCDMEMKCRIFVSKFNNDVFTSAVPLDESINLADYSSTQPDLAIINSKEYLFFTSNRPGGYGGFDIWFCVREGEKFSSPFNAGAMINTIEDDISPFYDTITNVLYFSSPWHYGLGGFDIFKSEGAPGSFTKPVNLGYPLNSSANDLYYSFEDVSHTGFLTSNRKGSITHENETCCNDIWNFELLVEEPELDSMALEIVKENPLDELEQFIPIKLYFHNDEPNPKSKDTVTTLNYLATYESYKGYLPEYKDNYSKGISGEKKKAAEDSMQSFFTNELEANVKMLEEFTETLFKQLEKGYKLDVTVKGHASPLANSNYNVNLTLRRISSLENYFREFKGGVLIPYLEDTAKNKGHLKLIKVPFGEYKAESIISDNLNDKKSSVYSIAAAKQRNIEIVSVAMEHKDSLKSKISFRKEVHNFGHIAEGEKVTHAFKFRNIGLAPLEIMKIIGADSSLIVQGPKTSIATGEKGEILITLDTAGMKGKKVYTIILITNGVPERKELNVTVEVN